MSQAIPDLSEPSELLPAELPPEVIKPIETRYAGCRFRSRLEARWAVFFDHLGIDWEYEPEGYKVAGKPYLPDFWLPELKLWAEVKGVADFETFEHLVAGCHPQSGLPASPNGARWWPTTQAGRILLLGQIPRAGEDGWVHSRIDYINDVASLTRVVFHAIGPASTTVGPVRDSIPFVLPDDCLYRREGDRADLLTGHPDTMLRPDMRVLAAYRAARMARFEHGESGTPVELAETPPTPIKRYPRQRKSPKAVPLVGPIESQYPEMLPTPEPVRPRARRRKPAPLSPGVPTEA